MLKGKANPRDLPAVSSKCHSLPATFVALGILLVACSTGLAIDKKSAGYEPQEGDIIFQSLPHNPIIDAIEGSTECPFSHCGILHRSGRQWVVIEAIGPVKESPLRSWIGQGREGRHSVFRLKTAYRPKIPAFVKAAQSYAGLPYDIHYDFDDEAIYCSELIFKAFKTAAGEEMGTVQTLGELRWDAYASVIRQIEGGKLPLHRKMITPRSLSEARQLEKIHESGE